MAMLPITPSQPTTCMQHNMPGTLRGLDSVFFMCSSGSATQHDHAANHSLPADHLHHAEVGRGRSGMSLL
jgi:hypothetical protein